MTQPPWLRRNAVRGASLAMRLASLAGKLALSLYMAKTFDLAELGLYGLAFGTVMLAIVLLGCRIDYVLSREIAGLSEDRRRATGAGVALLFLASSLMAVPPAIAAILWFDIDLSAPFVIVLFLLCGTEAYANYLYTVTIALQRPALANALFFIRSGLWTAPAILLSWIWADLRNVEFVLACWLVGTSASVAINLMIMRGQLVGPLRHGLQSWIEIRTAIASALMIWVGSIAVVLGGYVDRYVLASSLSLEDVGTATFYGSFTAAVITLVQSATTNISLPTLIAEYDARRFSEFHKELRKTARSAFALCVSLSLLLAVIVYHVAGLIGKSQIVSAYPAFLLLLLATLFRTHAETLYNALFVIRAHRAIWAGNLVFLGATIAFNLLLIPRAGLLGLGYAAIASALILALWRHISLGRTGALEAPRHQR